MSERSRCCTVARARCSSRLTVAMVVFTSRVVDAAALQVDAVSAGNIRRLAIVTAVLAYLQIVLGAVTAACAGRCAARRLSRWRFEVSFVSRRSFNDPRRCCWAAWCCSALRHARPINLPGGRAGSSHTVPGAVGRRHLDGEVRSASLGSRVDAATFGTVCTKAAGCKRILSRPTWRPAR